MHDPISVLVTRGGTVESVHRVHAVAVTDEGEQVAAIGDGDLVTFMRSSSKPLQALPLARAYADLDSEQLAIACASHRADDDQLAAAAALLATAGATEADLECGSEGDPPSRLRHNCSGKHAGMLALCRANGWPTSGYRQPEHSVQQAMLREVASATAVPREEIATAVDGCGVVTFAISLRSMAVAFARLEHIDGGDRVAAAMRLHPPLIRGAGSPDTEVMEALPGWIAKGGAEALFCAATGDGVGVALKVEDGQTRAVGPAVGAFLAELGHELPALRSRPVQNSHGEIVGEIVVQPR